MTAPGCHPRELPQNELALFIFPRCRHRRVELPPKVIVEFQNELALFLFRSIVGVVPEAPAQADNGGQAHVVH